MCFRDQLMGEVLISRSWPEKTGGEGIGITESFQ